jgi:hypothetical protein
VWRGIDGALLLQLPKLKADWCRLENDWILVKGGRSRSFHFEHNLYSGRELKDRLVACGFKDVQLYGDLVGSSFDLDAKRLVVVARKRAA